MSSIFRRLLHSARPSPKAPSGRLAFAFDIDGVLKQGRNVLPEGRRVLKLLASASGELDRPIPFVLMTNGGGMREMDRCAALSEEFGVQISPDQLVQSHTPLRNMVEQYRSKPVLVIGGEGESGRAIAESYGLRQAYLPQDLIAWRPSLWDRYKLSAAEENWVKRDVDFSEVQFSSIFVIHDGGLDWALTTQLITELLMSEGGRLGTRAIRGSQGPKIPVIFTNPDLIWSTDYPQPRLGMGALRVGLSAVYKALTGEEMPYEQIGKPYKRTYQYADDMIRRYLKALGSPSNTDLKVYMVGDNPASDIAGAQEHGWSSLLVKTGVFREEDGRPVPEPTHIADNVEEAVHWAIQREIQSKGGS